MQTSWAKPPHDVCSRRHLAVTKLCRSGGAAHVGRFMMITDGHGRICLPQRSHWRLALFRLYLRFLIWRRFSAVRLSLSGPPAVTAGPLIVYANHPSWWDPALMLLALPRMLPQFHGYGPMDAAELKRYALLRHMGVFGIDPHTRAGAADFLRVGGLLLRDPRTLLCITAEGAFTDPRRRPISLRPGLAHLARSHPNATILPLALEYSFWNESKPEALLRFGKPVTLPRGATVVAWQEALTEALTAAMDGLSADSATREAARFTKLYDGTAGVGGIYDLQRRLRAASRLQPFSARHEPGSR